MRGTGKRALWLVIGFSLACGGGSAAPVAPAPTAAPASPSGGGGGGGGGATASTAGAATAGSARASDWDGKEKFYCGGNENKLIRDVTTTLKDEYVIEAAGLCKLRIENSKITGGAYAVYATGMAEVTIVGGELHGTTNSIYATGEAKVHVDGTYLDGPTEQAGAGVIDGPGPRSSASGTSARTSGPRGSSGGGSRPGSPTSSGSRAGSAPGTGYTGEDCDKDYADCTAAVKAEASRCANACSTSACKGQCEDDALIATEGCNFTLMPCQGE